MLVKLISVIRLFVFIQYHAILDHTAMDVVGLNLD